MCMPPQKLNGASKLRLRPDFWQPGPYEMKIASVKTSTGRHRGGGGAASEPGTEIHQGKAEPPSTLTQQ